MKCIVAFVAVLAVASAGYLTPTLYSGYTGYTGYTGYNGYSPLAYNAYPYAAAYAAPIAHAYTAPIAAIAPIQSGYVAQTRGSLHVAPHPEGPFTASHHINTAPAPGTL